MSADLESLVHFCVAGSALFALICFEATKRLWVHSLAVLVSAGLWFLYSAFVLPWSDYSGISPVANDFAQGVVLDCFAMTYLVYHCLLVVALLLQIVRICYRDAH